MSAGLVFTSSIALVKPLSFNSPFFLYLMNNLHYHLGIYSHFFPVFIDICVCVSKAMSLRVCAADDYQ